MQYSLEVHIKFCLALSVCAAPNILLAADNGPSDLQKWAATELDEVDEDFAYQGEYAGYLLTENGMRCPVGLQVVALGNRQFSAVEFAGGLPGSGWSGHSKAGLKGQIRNGVLELSDESRDLFVAPQVATVNSYRHGLLGELCKKQRVSPTMGAPAPPGAIRLFDGTTTEHFKNGKITPNGWLDMGTELIDSFHDYTLHVEFKLPYMPHARGQGRANSGVYLQSRYEVQVLDSFGLEGKENECAAVYRYRRPDINMCLPPLSWQTYDIHFRSPRFDASGNKICNARLTVVHNGVVVHNDVEIERKTGAGKPEAPEPLPIKLQDHGNPVHFRNIWIIPRSFTEQRLARSSTVLHACAPNSSRCGACRRGLLGLLKSRPLFMRVGR